MQIKAKLPSPFGENSYNFVLTDVNTGEVKQDITTHNIILDRFWKDQYFWGSSERNNVCTLALGSGIGNISSSDTNLFSPLMWGEPDRYNNKTICKNPTDIKNFFSEDFLSVKVQYTYEYPPTGSYIGKITEAGLGYRNEYYYNAVILTHCLLKDAEGNPISINKTENDKLKVTVIYNISIPNKVGDFYLSKLNTPSGYFASFFANSYRGYSLEGYNIYGNGTMSLLLSQTPTDFRGNKGYIAGDVYGGKVPRDKVISYASRRMGAQDLNNHYFFGILFGGIGYYSLPNANVFPPYKIEKIPIGIGDGNIIKFKNPLNYFMKDTDIIYINDQPKQRGVDYIIDNNNNIDKLPELSAGNFIKKIKQDKKGYSYNLPSYVNSLLIPPQRTDNNESYYINELKDGKGILNDEPIFLEFEVPIKLNFIKLSSIFFWRLNGSSPGDYTSGDHNKISFKLEASKDNINYSEIFSSELFSSYTGKSFNFPTTEEFKYWKIIFSISTTNDFTKCYLFIHSSSPGASFLGYVGDDQITFTNPPAKDDIITMDVQMDVPFKNENYVIDMSGEIEFV